MLNSKYNEDDLRVGIELALETGVSSSVSVEQILKYLSDRNTKAVPISNWSTLPPADVSVYAELGGVV